jgi:hypothetical protein
MVKPMTSCHQLRFLSWTRTKSIFNLKTFVWIGQYLSALRLAWRRLQDRQLVNKPLPGAVTPRARNTLLEPEFQFGSRLP